MTQYKPTEDKEMGKYYLIEEYTEYDDRPCGSSWKAYDVQSFTTAEQLKDAILKGSKHDGKLMPAKGLELKLELIDDEKQCISCRLKEDTERRKGEYEKGGEWGV